MPPHAAPSPLAPGTLWRSLDREEARAGAWWGAWNRAQRCAPAARFDYAGITATLSAVAFEPRPRHVGESGCVIAVAAAAGTSADVIMPLAMAQRLAHRWMGAALPAALEGPASAADTACGVWWLAAMSDALGWRADVRPAARASPHTSAGGIALSWHLDEPAAAADHAFTIWIRPHAEAPAMTASAAPAIALDASRGDALWARTKLAWPISVGSTSLATNDLSRLQAGAYVIGIERHQPALIAGGVAWRVSQPQPFTSTIAVISELSPMKPDSSTTTALLAHGRCPVSVVMAHAELSFAELAQLQPGSVIELGQAPSPRAALYLGATHLADVELVDVEGQLAARVLALRSVPPQPAAAPVGV